MHDIQINKFLHNFEQVKWACRRGMLELDVLLQNFLLAKYADSSTEEKISFIKLLDQSDPELFAWLMGKEEPSDPALTSIINSIRLHAKSKF